VSYEKQELDLDFAKKLIIDYFSRPEYLGFKPLVRFFAAGEPILSIDGIKALVEFSRSEIGDHVEFELQTNGILTRQDGEYDVEMADWIAKNIDYIWISCDGTPDVQNYYRPIFNPIYSSPPKMLSHEIVEKTISHLLPICKKMVGIRLTIVNMNIDRQEEMIQYFYDLGIRDIWADPLFPSVGAEKAFEEIDLEKFSEKFLEACEFASSFGIDPNDERYDKVIYGSNYTCNFDEEVRHYCRACKPVPHATTDGYVSCCDMAMFREEDGSQSIAMNELLYGSWNSQTECIEYDEHKMEQLRARNCDNIPHCRTCIAKLHCAGYCLGEVANETGRIDGVLLHKCNTVQTLYRRMNDRQRKYRYSHP